MTLHWLEAVCDPERTGVPSFVNAPKTAELNGEPYTVASDGSRIVFLRGSFGYEPTSSDDGRSIADYFEPTGRLETKTAQVSVSALREWISEAIPCDYVAEHGSVLPCPGCKGSKSHECECDECGNKHQTICEKCNGTLATAVWPRIEACLYCDFDPEIGVQPRRPGWIGEVLINRHLLDGIISNITERSLALTRNGPLDPIYLIGTDIRVVVMPMRKTAMDKADAISSLDEFLTKRVPKMGRKLG